MKAAERLAISVYGRVPVGVGEARIMEDAVLLIDLLRRGSIKAPEGHLLPEPIPEGAPRGDRPKAGRRLAPDWQPSPDLREYAEARGLDTDRTAEEFRDYWLAATGRKSQKHDWSAAFRTWCRRQIQFNAAPKPRRKSFEEIQMDLMMGAVAGPRALPPGGLHG